MRKKTKFYSKVNQKWVIIDAKGKVLGRLACRVANILQGKNKPTYSPNFLCGDRVVVINARYVRVTGKKLKEKVYDKYSGYPGGRKEISLQKLIEKNPAKVIYYAVRGMLPKNMLAKRMLRMLKVYPDEKHDHNAQKPQVIEV